MPRCQHIKTDGERCQARALAGSASCFFHDPEKADERKAARKAGGQASGAAVLPDTPRQPLKTSAEVTALLAETIHQVLRGQLDPKTANTIGYLSNIFLKARAQTKIERHLAILEQVVFCQSWHYPREEITSVDHLVERGSA